MKIGIDISQIAYAGTGVGRFTQGLTSSILRFNKIHQWTFFFSSFRRQLPIQIEKDILSYGHHLVKLPFPPTLLSFFLNDLHSLSKYLTFNFKLFSDLDWFITSDWSEPAMNTKKATIVHDLVFKKFPETLPNSIVHNQSKRLSHVMRESQIIFTDSKSTSRDLVAEYGIDPKKLTVNYPGVDFKEPLSTKSQENYLYEIGLKKPYILTVGKIEPRKNLEKLIEAFKLIRIKHDKKLELVIVGPKGWKMNLQESTDIKILGFVTDEQLSTLYSNATCFAYPSLYEGFGYPVIESMLHGCPVASSSVSSLPEIAGEAAILFDPQNAESIANAISKILGNSTLRSQLSQRGKIRAKQFTWERYYNKLIDTLALN